MLVDVGIGGYYAPLFSHPDSAVEGKKTMLSFPKWIVAGGIGGLIGAAIWAGISYATNYEVGWIAWGVGFLVGVGVRVSAGENEEGFAPGLTAAVVAIVAVLGGK